MTGPPKPFRLDGTELAGYRIDALIGRGGMAYVYRAVDQRLGRTVALKVLAPELSTDAEFRRRFLRESRLAASIDHPNVIPIYDAGETDGVLYIAMRFVEGSDLKALLAREPQLDIGRAVDIFAQVADALDAAHAHGLVHRDVKPANILLSPGTVSQGHEHVYLSDFGVTKRATSKSGVTAAGVIVGTMDYLAPEQIAGKAVSARTDVYALGCVVYQSLTGSVPFVRDDDAALLWAHLVEPLPSVSQVRPDVPAAVDDVLLKATAKDPEDRYAGCGEFLAELSAVLQAHRSSPDSATAGPYPPVAGVQAGPAAQPRTGPPYSGTRGGPTGGRSIAVLTSARQRPRRRWIWAVVAGAVAVALAVAGFLVVRSSGTDTMHFTATDEVPVSFDYPADWGPPAQEGVKMVVSPHADAFLQLFNQLGTPASWDEISRVLRADRGGAIGMYTTWNQTGFDGGSLRLGLPTILPLTDPNPSWAPAKLGASDALKFGGTFAHPGDSTTQLGYACYIGQATAPDSRNVHMIFFADAESFDSHLATFDRIAQSAVLQGS